MQKIRKSGNAWMIPIYIILIFWELTTIYPLFWVAMNSFKIKNEIISNSFAVPTG